MSATSAAAHAASPAWHPRLSAALPEHTGQSGAAPSRRWSRRSNVRSAPFHTRAIV